VQFCMVLGLVLVLVLFGKELELVQFCMVQVQELVLVQSGKEQEQEQGQACMVLVQEQVQEQQSGKEQELEQGQVCMVLVQEQEQQDMHEYYMQQFWWQVQHKRFHH